MGQVGAAPMSFSSEGAPSVRLEGLVATPESGFSEPRALALLCHPQPATSSLHDPLLETLTPTLVAARMVVLRFNFRGVGTSQGEMTDGRLEPLDIAGAVRYAREHFPTASQHMALVGHAFGGWMALVYAGHAPGIQAVVAISPPIVRLDDDALGYAGPQLYITGELDEVAPEHKLRPWLARQTGVARLAVIPGARYLMRGYEARVSHEVVRFLREALEPNERHSNQFSGTEPPWRS